MPYKNMFYRQVTPCLIYATVANNMGYLMSNKGL